MARVGEKIPGPPGRESDSVLFYASFEVPKHYSKKNQKQVGMRRGGSSRFAKRTGYTPFIMSNDSARNSERELLLLLMQNGMFGVHIQSPIKDMAVRGVFIIESQTALTKKGKINLRGGDLDNLVTSYLDLLTKANVIYDDSILVSLIAHKKYCNKNRVTIWLLKDETFGMD